jgi:CBS-domain-containing membrane protein
MTPADQVAYVFSGNSVESCLAIMADVQCHHLPVLDKHPVEGGVLQGVVAMEELLGLTAEARMRSMGAIAADTIARLPGFAALGTVKIPADAKRS